MGGLVSKLLQLFYNVFPNAPVSRSHTSTVDENAAEEGEDRGAYQGGNAPLSESHTSTIDENAAEEGQDSGASQGGIGGVTEEGTVIKHSARDRLDGLSSFRIQLSDIEFNSETSGGRGGKADVVKATFRGGNGTDEQLVAVKKIRYHDGMDKKKFCNEFVNEVEMVARLSHENIIRLVGFIEDFENGEAWTILSWEPNGNLSEFIKKEEWEIPERVSLIKDTFEGVRYLHTREPPIRHGDLKSFNVLVSSSYRAVITDFGSSRRIIESEGRAVDEEHDREAEGNLAGEDSEGSSEISVTASGNELTLTGPTWSLRWAAPEVLKDKDPDLASDIWAAGWVCWEVMTNKIPFPELGLFSQIVLTVIRGNIPSAREEAQLAQIMRLCSLMTDCWRFDPKARPSIGQCCNELQWMPSTPPSRQRDSGTKAPSTELLLEMVRMHYLQDNFTEATSLAQQALSLARSEGDQATTARALRGLGNIHRHQSKYAQAEEFYTQALEIYNCIGDDLGQGRTLDGLGEVYYYEAPSVAKLF